MAVLQNVERFAGVGIFGRLWCEPEVIPCLVRDALSLAFRCKDAEVREFGLAWLFGRQEI